MLSTDPRPRPHIHFPFQTSRRLTKRHLLLSVLLLIVILSGVIAGWSTGILRTHADGPLDSAAAGMTFDQFINEGRQDTAYHGPLVFPGPTPPLPTSKWRHYTNYATLPPSVEPATMKPLTSALNSTLLTGSTGASALDFKGSDGRLEVQIQPGSLNLTHATVSSGVAPVGAMSLHLVQLYGHTIGQKSVLGTYQLQVLDSQNHVVHGLALHTPVTIIYHYQPSELAGLGLDPGRITLSWPTLIAAAQQAKQPITGLSIPMHNDPVAHTLTAQTTVIDATPFTASGAPANQSLTALKLASVQGNSGQSSYSYPLQVPPGTGGFTPHLTLTYSSAGPNERHNATSPAGDEGDGWSLNLGSISAEVYPTSPNPTTWYFLNNVANVGDRLIPSTGSSFDTQHISYLKIQQATVNNQSCFQVWDKSGTYYELGCTPDSLQYWTDSTGKRTITAGTSTRLSHPTKAPAAPTTA